MVLRRFVSFPGLAAPAAVGFCLGAILLAGCSTEFGPDDARAEQAILVRLGASEMDLGGLSPNPVTVIARTRVTWVNNDTTEHKIASFSGIFEGQVIQPGETWSFIFAEPAVYQYRCLIPGHSERGTINVTP